MRKILIEDDLKFDGENYNFDEVVWCDHPDFVPVTGEKIVDKSRWSLLKERTFKRNSDGTFWRVVWQVGATEYQDSQEPDYTMTQVRPVTKTITVYEDIK